MLKNEFEKERVNRKDASETDTFSRFDSSSFNPADLISTKRAAVIIDKQPGTLEVWRHQGKGPKFYKIGRSVRYYKPDLIEFLAQCCCMSTSEY